MRNVIVAIGAAVVITGVFVLPAFERMDGLGIDSLFWLRDKFIASDQAAASHVVVIAVDEETYRRPPFRDIPKAMWTNQFAGIIEATLNAGARVVGFDVIFPTSVEQYLSGFDRSFLLALRNGSTQGKIVLGKVQHQVKPIGPHRSQSFAVGHQKNIRSVNLSEDNDGIIRRLPLTFRARTVDNQIRTETSMALELASRGLGQSPQATDNGSLRLGDYLIPGSRQNNMTLNFDGAVNAIPTLSLADVHRCVEVGNVEFLKEHLAGKVVLFGSVLDVEDRKLTPKRFITVREDIGQTQRCSYPIMSGLYRDDLVRDTIPGVFVHATAINNLMRGDALREFDSWVPVAISFSVALLVAAVTMLFAPWRAAALTCIVFFAWSAIATLTFRGGVVLPLFEPLGGGALVFVALLGYRVAVSDKDKRYLRRAFSYYLSPAVIERMISQDKLPVLGGESREITIMFSDIASFTTLSEGLNANQVAHFLNEYLTEMSTIVESYGGYIEKFVADEITAVFGAPLDDPDHAVHATEAALASRRSISEMRGAFGLPRDRAIAARFGLNSGEMLVENIGSRRRFTYAAMGDAANLGSQTWDHDWRVQTSLTELKF